MTSSSTGFLLFEMMEDDSEDMDRYPSSVFGPDDRRRPWNGSSNSQFCFSARSRNATSGENHPLVWIYISPIVLCVGLVGNTLTLLVMRRKMLSSSTTSVYLSLMSVADNLALITRIVPECLRASGTLDFSSISLWTCRMEKFSFYTSSDVAIWILVAFTFDRLIAVCFPLQKRRVCKRRNACLGVTVIAAIACLKNLHVFWTRGVELDSSSRVLNCCGRTHNYEIYVRPWLAFALISVLPLIIIIACNMFIIRTLAYVRSLSAPATSCRRTFTQTSLMCISVSLTFLICVMPSIMLSAGKAHWSTGEGRDLYKIARTINNQLACLNHAVNFFLYCLTGERFRNELLVMFRLRAASDLGPGGIRYSRPPSLWSTGNIRLQSMMPTNGRTRSSTSLLYATCTPLQIARRSMSTASINRVNGVKNW